MTKVVTSAILYKCFDCQHQQYHKAVCLKCGSTEMYHYRRCPECKSMIWGDNMWRNGNKPQTICSGCQKENKRWQRKKK